MRQAGRYLPEYRALLAKAGSILELCYTPALAAEAALQPIRRYGFDAAIVFSDILVVPNALGQAVAFTEGEGWLKALHIIAVIAGMAGLLYLPRLFVYHCQSPARSRLPLRQATVEDMRGALTNITADLAPTSARQIVLRVKA